MSPCTRNLASKSLCCAWISATSTTNAATSYPTALTTSLTVVWLTVPVTSWVPGAAPVSVPASLTATAWGPRESNPSICKAPVFNRIWFERDIYTLIYKILYFYQYIYIEIKLIYKHHKFQLLK